APAPISEPPKPSTLTCMPVLPSRRFSIAYSAPELWAAASAARLRESGKRQETVRQCGIFDLGRDSFAQLSHASIDHCALVILADKIRQFLHLCDPAISLWHHLRDKTIQTRQDLRL